MENPYPVLFLAMHTNSRDSTDLRLENSDKPCDTGTPVTALGREFPQVDFSELDGVYPDKSTPAGAKYAFERKALLARGQSALKALYDRPEKVIIVVSHSAFMRMCVTGSWFYNSDYRIFDFVERVEGNLDGEYKLKEADETREKGGGLGLSFKHTVVLGSELADEEPSG